MPTTMSTSRNSWSCRSAPHRSPKRCAGAWKSFTRLKGVLKKRGYNTAVGDEGGFAPSVKSNVEAIEVVLEAIQQAGYKPGEEIAIALDPAASEFFQDGKYVFKKSDKSAKSFRRNGRASGRSG